MLGPLQASRRPCVSRAPWELVNSAMASHLISARPEQSLAEVEQLMATHQVRRLPIVDGDGKPVGVISIDDLAKPAALPVQGRAATVARRSRQAA